MTILPAKKRLPMARTIGHTLAACAVALLLAPPASISAAETNRDKPNIVIFLVDDMGVMDTSVPFLTDASGRPKRYPLNDYYRTPNMDRLAGRGIRSTTSTP
jgi:hypothetical protein